MQSRFTQMMCCELELQQTQKHAYAGSSESIVPVDLLAERAAQERTNRRAQIDPHVEDREPGIALAAPFGIKLSHDHADVRLEQASAQHDQHQSQKERLAPLD